MKHIANLKIFFVCIGMILLLVFSAGNLLAQNESTDETTNDTPESATTDTENETDKEDEANQNKEDSSDVKETTTDSSNDDKSDPKDKTDGLWTKPDNDTEEETPAETNIAAENRPTLLDTSLKFRIEASLGVDFLVPFDNYGTWETLLVSFYHTPIPNLTYFVTVGGMLQRDKGVGYLGAGVYVDWTAFLSTLTEVSSGLYAQFYPVFTAHHEFNLHLLSEPALSLNFGVTYIQSKHNETIGLTNKTLIPQAGLTFAMNNWTFEYRLSVDIAFPGTHVGLAHMASVNYGKDGEYFCYLSVSGGKSSYLSDIGTRQVEVNHYYVGASIGHRHWIKYNWGLFGELRYLWLKDEYNLVGVMFGGFYAW